MNQIKIEYSVLFGCVSWEFRTSYEDLDQKKKKKGSKRGRRSKFNHKM